MRILVTSPRVAPGLMTLAAWDAVREAGRVIAADTDDPTVEAIRHAGFTVEPAPPGPVDTSAEQGSTLWIAPIGDVDWARRLADSLVSAAGGGVDAPGEVEVVFGSYDLPGARLLDLVAVMDQLRVECPWTREQTHASLQQYLLEEAYEVLDALDRGDTDELREELGDLLMQVVFHAAVAARPGDASDSSSGPDGWDIDDVAAGIVEKLVRRNPHVFADGDAATPEEVDAAWQRLKATEKQRSSVLDGVPPTLPALAYADKVVGRLEREGTLVEATGDAVGDRLLALVLAARAAGEDPEAALRRTVNALVE
ncbi:MazG family protein [Mumia sp. zg.B17]|uniref:MazG family protein n=1 Tax=Mumia sp. zg.B17 TaxID=2855446 RepID=UPI0027E23C2D|nr:MazG family protein [Mumia sp. zg.B17]